MILSLDRHSSDFLPQNERRSWVRRIFLSTKARARAEADRRVCSRFVTSQRNRRLLERRSFQALEEREPSRSCSEVLLGQEERLVPYLALWRRDQRSSFGRRLGEDGESTASRFFFFFSSFLQIADTSSFSSPLFSLLAVAKRVLPVEMDPLSPRSFPSRTPLTLLLPGLVRK